ncbi:unnamed protein product [Closterium sp. NIES-54]
MGTSTEQYGRGPASSDALSTFCSSQSALSAAEAKARSPRRPPVRSRFSCKLASCCAGVGGSSSTMTGVVVPAAADVVATADVVSAAADVGSAAAVC